MSGRRSALIVATYAYDDAGLAGLRAPEHDAEGLARVLGDPAVGAFEVETVLNRPAHEVNRAVASFFRGGRPDDLFLVHFSCHGLKDDSGELYFATQDTALELLEATSVSSSFVDQAMHRSRAGTVLLLLDCCYSGAFGRGYVPRAGGTVDVGDRLGGSGRAVITASSALQYAFEGSDLADSASDTSPSVFTSALVKGLATGEADRDLDGWVSLDELYGYIYDEVTAANPHQTPERRFEVQGDLMVARRSQPVTTASDLSAELLRSLTDVLPWVRGSAVPPLEALLRGSHPGLALAARRSLQQMADGDDSLENRSAARIALDGAPAPDDTTVLPFPDLAARLHPPAGREPDGSGDREPDRPPDRDADRQPIRQAVQQPVQSLAQPAVQRPTWVRRHRRALGAAAVVTALLAGLLAWRWPRDDGGGGESRPSLSSDAMVLTVTGPDDAQRLVSVSTSDGTVHPIETGPLTAGFPTVSPNRDEMAFLVADSEGNQTPYLARVDGSRARRLVSAEDQPRCPYARRPAWSPDGTRLAVACQDKNQRDVALVVFDTRGHRGVVLDADRAYAGAPSWGDDSWVYFGVEDASGGATSTLWRVPDDGAASAKPWRSVPGRCLSQPDWSANGVLFRSVECGKGSGEAEVVVASPDGPVDGRKDRTLAIRDAEWPTWSSDGSAVTWLESDRLKWADAENLEVSREINGLGGTPGPPAWGSR